MGSGSVIRRLPDCEKVEPYGPQTREPYRKRTRFGLFTLSGCGQASDDDEACYPRGRNGRRHLRDTPGWLGRARAERCIEEPGRPSVARCQSRKMTGNK